MRSERPMLTSTRSEVEMDPELGGLVPIHM